MSRFLSLASLAIGASAQTPQTTEVALTAYCAAIYGPYQGEESLKHLPWLEVTTAGDINVVAARNCCFQQTSNTATKIGYVLTQRLLGSGECLSKISKVQRPYLKFTSKDNQEVAIVADINMATSMEPKVHACLTMTIDSQVTMLARQFYFAAVHLVGPASGKARFWFTNPSTAKLTGACVADNKSNIQFFDNNIPASYQKCFGPNLLMSSGAKKSGAGFSCQG